MFCGIPAFMHFTMDRRDFLKRVGAGAASVALAGCGMSESENEKVRVAQVPTGAMTYRTNPTTGDKVSILGYGCMRWPTDEEDNIDQEMVNRLVDYALEHGVNYFDTSPA